MGEKKGFFSRLVSGLTKTRKNIASGLDAIFSGFSKIDDDFYEELEEILTLANRAASVTCSRSGAIPAMPTLEELAQ